jgi:hypothetical protein
MEISNPEQQLQQTTMETTTMEQSDKKLVNIPSFNFYQAKTSIYNDLLVYITSGGKIYGINMQYTSGINMQYTSVYYFVYPEDKVNFNSSINVIHTDKSIIIYDGVGVFLQAELPPEVHQEPSKPFQRINLEWEVIETPFPNGLEMFICRYFHDIFVVIRDNNIYFYNSTRKNWTTTTKLEPNSPYGEYLYQGKNLLMSFANTTTATDNIAGITWGKTNTYFLVVNSTTTSDDLQIVPVTNPHNQLHKFVPCTALNILVDLQNPTESTASLRYIKLDRFRPTCYTTDNEWTQLPLPQQQIEQQTANKQNNLIYTQIIIIENTIILVTLTGVYYIENAFIQDKPNQDTCDWQWKKLEIYNSSKNPLYQHLQTNNLFSVRDLETNQIIIEKESLIPLSILYGNPEKLLPKQTFIMTLDGRFILISKDSNGIFGREMVTMMPPLKNPEELKHIFDNCMFYDRYKFDYLTYDKERARLDMLVVACKAAMDISESKQTTTEATDKS